MTLDSHPTAEACFLCGGTQALRFALGERRLLYCRRCEIGQLAPLPSPAELAALYASEAYFRGDDEVGYADYAARAPQHARSFRRQAQWLLRHGAVGELLEIGCGPGLFLEEAARLGVARPVGVDLNPWAVAAARARGLDVRLGSVDAIAPTPGFDAVAMLDVLEHVPAPLPFLASVRQRLRPGGRLLLMTPNIRSALARVSGRRWVSLKIPEHVRYYSPRGIRALLTAAAFEVLAVRSAGQYVTVAFALERLRRLLPPAWLLQRAAHALGAGSRVIFLTNGSIDVVARVAPGAD